jgi:AcrR family transcriptional regulator
MGRGAETRAAILGEALELTSRVGLEGLSIGVLAKRTGMSKSGLYAHFDSKEGLQRDVLREAADRWTELVIRPALREPRGLPRLEKLFERWIAWDTEAFTGGCPFMAAAIDFDDRKGPVRDAVAGHIRDALSAVARAVGLAVDEGHLRADTDVEQVTFELWGILAGFQQYARLLADERARARADRAFAALIQRHRA